jgi:aminopeptidase-like protein
MKSIHFTVQYLNSNVLFIVKTSKESGSWKKALNEIWRLNRVHVSSEMSLAYRLLKKHYKKIKIFGYQSGKSCLGWTAPPSWDVNKAILKDPYGKEIADWSKNKLSLWTYSPSFKGKVEKKQLLKKIVSNPKKPNATVFHFRNQYNFWNAEWGFSLPHKVYKKLKNGKYDVDIKTKLSKGKLEMAEQEHKGKLKDSLLLVGHFDHPQMCLDGLVGCLAGHEVISRLKNKKTNLTYRMLSTVEIIGSVFYSKYHAKKKKIRQALFIATAGANQNLHYQSSFSKNNIIDRVSIHAIKYLEDKSKTFNFRQGPLGNDEIAYDVGGVNIPCGSIMRAPFDAYHTDADTPAGVSSKKFEDTILVIQEIIYILEKNSILKRKFAGLPCLSSKKYNLYLSHLNISGVTKKIEMHKLLAKDMPKKMIKYLHQNQNKLNYLMNILPNMCEGDCTILDIAEFVGLPFRVVNNYVDMWVSKNLIEKYWVNPFKKT